jgi:hypothetical protein
MIIHTTAEGISLAKKLEDEAAGFYEDLASKYPRGADILLSLARDCRKYVNQIEMAYYSVISDALEGCFALNLETDNYSLDTKLAAESAFPDVVKKVMGIEGTLVNFYMDAAEQCQAVMADVPRVMTQIAQKRKKRKPELEALLT